ncbi:uncharacterized protein LOC100570799 [Acyrthosiphon pisum]|uniref:Uncharacterized protein n=1 Tax=Acyrthosiphon pisum TaxID=7029 RepID=A0A8R1WBD4_ACYPI|nr:uncharacterized protein LOC100570799 [Acyrthosiphon pisum]|eukprot:XP_003245554.1 PREDICTED: uncharacterized protein LOC100570799 [Acyrthosiphon pisum]
MNNLGDVNQEDEIMHIVELPAATVESTLSSFLGLTTLAGHPLDAADAPALIMKKNSTFKVRHRGLGTRRSVYMVEETRYFRVGDSELRVWIVYERLPRLRSKVGSARIAYLVEKLTFHQKGH